MLPLPFCAMASLRAGSGDRDRADAGRAAREEVAPADLGDACRTRVLACSLSLTSRMPILAILLDDDDGSVRLPELGIKAQPTGAWGWGMGRALASFVMLVAAGAAMVSPSASADHSCDALGELAGRRCRRTRSSTSRTARPIRPAATGWSTAPRPCCRCATTSTPPELQSALVFAWSRAEARAGDDLPGGAAVAPYAGPCPPK